jgi:hypothetical protein
VITLLARLAGGPADSDRARELLHGAVSWLTAQKLDGNGVGRFPSVIRASGKPTDRARTAWCYGDPGIATALFRAGRAAGVSRWEADALDLARDCANRAPDRCGVMDAGLCHGAAGLAHIYHRFHAASGERVFRDAAAQWFRIALSMRRPGEGIAGFQVFTPVPEPHWRTERGFLEGAIGIGLALMAATDGGEPGWDRLLLCDLPLG